MIDRNELCRLIPHYGNMCLLERVMEWDNKTIICEATSHRDKSNPLCCDGVLSSVVGIEYGAQAMAVHGGLLNANDETVVRTSYLAAACDVKFKVDWLHDIEHPLTIKAERLMVDANGMIYQFSLYALSHMLVQGRLTVMMSKNRVSKVKKI